MSTKTTFVIPHEDLRLADYSRSGSQELIAALEEVFGTGKVDRPVVKLVDSLLRDPNPPVDRVASVENLHRLLAGTEFRWMFGALGYFLFTRKAAAVASGRAVADGRKTTREEADEYLQNDAVRSFIVNDYEIKTPLTAETIWRLDIPGSTSLLIRVSGASDLALKLIKPRFFDREDIRRDAAQYCERFRLIDGPAPTVVESGDRFILMKYIDGKTLGRYLKGLREPVPLEVAKTIVLKLCEVLENFHRQGVKHLDLAPENIIIEAGSLAHLTGPNVSIWLIDFGANHILSQGVGSLAELEDLRSYVAPEVIKDPTSGSYLSDVYSLGRIALQLMAGSRKTARAADPKSTNSPQLSELLDDIWMSHPQFAALIEELVDSEPGNRLNGDRDDRTAMLALRGRLEREFELQKRIEDELASSGYLKVLEDLSANPLGAVKLVNRWRAVNHLTDGSEVDVIDGEARRNALKRLNRFCGVVSVSRGAVMLCFSYVFLAFADWASKRGRFPGPPVGARVDYLPGLAVGISFMFLASRYYLNIFSRISTFESTAYGSWAGASAEDKALGRLAARADQSMRSSAWVFAVLTTIGMLVDARWWPAFCALGAFATAVNNKIVFEFAKIANKKVAEVLGLPSSVQLENFMAEFRSWPGLMAVYGTLLVGVMVVFIAKARLTTVQQHAPYLVDQFVFAGIVVVLNAIMMVNNCTRRAPQISGGLYRLSAGVARIVKRRVAQNSANTAAPISGQASRT